MTFDRVSKSIRRLECEYNTLTDYGNITSINKCFDIKNMNVTMSHNNNNSRGIVINEVNIIIKRNNNKKIKQYLLNKLLPQDITNKIVNDYEENFNTLNVVINIEYDPLHYPFKPCVWKLVHINNSGFINETEKAIHIIIYLHNQTLEYDWSCAISLRSDLNYFLSKLTKLMNYI